MFGIGWSELVICFLIVLLVFGPKRLPEIGIAVGKALRFFKEASREVRESMSDVHSEFESHFRDVQQAKKDLTRALLEAPEQEEETASDSDEEKEEAAADPGKKPGDSDEPEKPDDFQSPYAG